MEIYLVGGAVRDQLLGLPVKDRDWVVVGATPEMLLAQGYQQVGKDFPVFLNPENHEEYALARTERKSGKGYTGFICDFSDEITLEQDLIRRDLTINAIAQDKDGKLHDPYHGVEDIHQRILRHISPAFAEDPLRVLRVARFAARFHHLGFSIAEETLKLMAELTEQGELAHLTAERVWIETEKALNVYGALKRLIKKYDLNAVTVRCFDLLKAVHTTGCLALAILNAEGIPAACEGDQKSLISMVILNALTGGSGFMANPSCMDPKKKEIIFAHCTLPIDMPDDYNLTTHFESGVGVAVAGNLESQEMTIFKCDETMKRYYAGRATLLETMHRKDLCRTQMKLYLEDGTEYFAKSPISNHHIICKGDWKEVIDQFFEQM